jgi:hypothetical protein
MYAYDFINERIGIDHSLIFVAMPFDDKYDFIYNDLIIPAADAANKIFDSEGNLPVRTFRTKDDIRTKSGWLNVLENLSDAQIVIGVLTGNNKNVFYELGIAHATQQIARQILIAYKGYKPSFDVKDLIYLKYNKKNIGASIGPLADKIVSTIKAYNLEKENVVKKARGSVGMSGFTAIMAYGSRQNFAVHTADLKDNDPLRDGLDILCQRGLLYLNTASERDAGSIEFSYWWTGIGNDVLRLLKIITEDDLLKRRKTVVTIINY